MSDPAFFLCLVVLCIVLLMLAPMLDAAMLLLEKMTDVEMERWLEEKSAPPRGSSRSAATLE